MFMIIYRDSLLCARKSETCQWARPFQYLGMEFSAHKNTQISDNCKKTTMTPIKYNKVGFTGLSIYFSKSREDSSFCALDSRPYLLGVYFLLAETSTLPP